LEGNILKLKSDLKSPVDYQLPIGDELIRLNQFLGKKIRIEFKGQINCIHSGDKIKKSYNQGFSYKSFLKLACCDICIVKPELCHYSKGTCREPKWGEENCFRPHIVYLANTSSLKIGITRESQIPTRWIDQGAVEALPLVRVPNRHASGLLEVEIKREINDKTNWRKMLSGSVEQIDLYEKREEIFDLYADLFDDLEAEDIDDKIIKINYPVLEYPTKIKSLSFDKVNIVEGILLGIKGQYLIFDIGVINLRKHQGHYLYFSVD